MKFIVAGPREILMKMGSEVAVMKLIPLQFLLLC